MRWGIREEADDNHTTIETCLREIEACQKLSIGPNFVVRTITESDIVHVYICGISLYFKTCDVFQTFLSHKYGYNPFPRLIPAKEFEVLTSDVTGSDKELIDQ